MSSGTRIVDLEDFPNEPLRNLALTKIRTHLEDLSNTIAGNKYRKIEALKNRIKAIEFVFTTEFDTWVQAGRLKINTAYYREKVLKHYQSYEKLRRAKSKLYKQKARKD